MDKINNIFNTLYLYSVIVLGLITIVASCSDDSSTSPRETIDPEIKCNWTYKGGSLAGYYNDAFALPDAFDQIDYMKNMGINTIAIIVTWYQDNKESIEIYKDIERSASDESITSLIKYIHDNNMKVNLKPHVDIQNGIWRGEINPLNIEQWFLSFSEFIDYYANLGINNNVDIFTIGTEMVSMTKEKDYWPYWHNLVKKIKEQGYSGLITYAAHEYEFLGKKLTSNIKSARSGGEIEYEREPLDYEFWNVFDLISTTVYYTVGSLDTPVENVSQIMANWEKWKEDIKYVYTNFITLNSDKQFDLVFGEIGYRSVDYAHYCPYDVEGANENAPSSAINYTAQKNCYEAAFRALCTPDMDFLKGVFWWQFEPKQAFEREYLVSNNYYSPINKPSSEILSLYFQGTTVNGPALRDLLLETDDTNPHSIFDLLSVDKDRIERYFEIQGTAEVNIALDDSVYFEKSNKSIFLEINNPPVTDKRFSQLIYYFPENKNLSNYDQIYTMIKCLLIEEHPEKFEFSLVLIDRKDPANFEYWQSTNLLKYSSEWQEAMFKIIDNSGPGDPFKKEKVFVLPEWSEIENAELDLTDIIGFMIKITTLDEDSHEFPGIGCWLDNIHLDQNVCSINYPIVESFEYLNERLMKRVWSVSTGDPSVEYEISLSSNYSLHNNQSLLLKTYLPSMDETVRWGEIIGSFCDVIDLTEYSYFRLSYKTISSFKNFSGKEISVGIVDCGSESDELWMKSGWHENKSYWSSITIPLIGISSENDPWLKDLNGFVVPVWAERQNGILDLDKICKIHIRINTTGDDADKFHFYDMTTAIDKIEFIK